MLRESTTGGNENMGKFLLGQLIQINVSFAKNIIETVLLPTHFSTLKAYKYKSPIKLWF